MMPPSSLAMVTTLAPVIARLPVESAARSVRSMDTPVSGGWYAARSSPSAGGAEGNSCESDAV